jgi:uncharacterized protein YqgC (DUF456 family)|tara:strand:+ start:4788 stop:5273 length:486 start_codon:yes stop_codon:yes gene_type:complete
MDIFLLLLGVIFCLVGIVGSFLPILPGPIASWCGLLILNFTSFVNFSFSFLIITFLIAFTVSIIDYIIPILGVQKLGGSKGGQIGATIGLLFGLFILGPVGLIFGPFLGALTGEVISKKNISNSILPAFGSLIGVLAGTVLKTIITVVFLIFFLYSILSNF